MSSDTVAVSARERLLAAADELFYEEGIHVVGIDRIIDKAGVAKATLYSTFGNKEGLILAYLQARLELRWGIEAGRARYDGANENFVILFLSASGRF